ncbi:MAG: S9 family peptidase [Candidatus Aminicenantes bacterium]|nr:S9 family peptidase [Candidatus Aminicenantes bacterium]
MKPHINRFVVCSLGILLALCASCKNAEDPYLWLEEVQGQRALDWVQAENDRTLQRLTGDPRFQALYEEGLEDLTRTDRLPGVTIIGEHTYDLLQDSKHIRGLWRRTLLESFLRGQPEWETVLDLDELAASEKKSWVFAGAVFAYPDNDLCMLKLSPGGSDAGVWREFDPKSKRFVSDGFQLPEAKSNVAWLDRNTLLVQAAFDAEGSTTSGYGRQIRRWDRGTAYEKAPVIMEVDSTHMGASPSVITDGDQKHILIVDMITIFDLDYYSLDKDGLPARLPLPAEFTLSGIFKGRAFGRLKNDWSHKGQSYPMGSIIAFDFAAIDTGGNLPDAEVVFTPKTNQAVQSLLGSGFLATGDALYFSLLEDVAGKLVRLTVTPEGWKSEYVEMPANGSVSVVAADHVTNTLIARYENFLTPPSLYFIRGQEKPVEFLALDPKMDTSDFQTVQHFATSKDSTRIPYFVTCPKGLEMNGSAPALLGAYGGFGFSMTPAYLGRIFGEGLPFKTILKAGGIYVLANIRGGAEYGPGWHTSGILHNRQRVYDDFHAVAEDVIERGYTSPEHLGIVGASNSGLLMGVAFTQRPDLYKAVLCGVPLLDMRRYHRLLAGASWIAEYGDPDDPEMWKTIKQYSPYHNLQHDREYPEVFFYTSTKDDRVHPGHARKMAAKMRAQKHSFLFFENIEGGHGAAANLNEKARLGALESVYLLQKLR